MQNVLSALLFVIFISFSCAKDAPEITSNLENNQLLIKTGTFCGWCGGADSLYLSSDVEKYWKISPCDSNDIEKETVVDVDSFKNLVSKISFDDFKSIELNTCNVCVDGCDTWISIEGPDYYHKIRYGFQDSVALEKIQPLVDALDEWRLKYIK